MVRFHLNIFRHQINSNSLEIRGRPSKNRAGGVLYSKIDVIYFLPKNRAASSICASSIKKKVYHAKMTKKMTRTKSTSQIYL